MEMGFFIKLYLVTAGITTVYMVCTEMLLPKQHREAFPTVVFASSLMGLIFPFTFYILTRDKVRSWFARYFS